MKKTIALVLAVILSLSMASVAFAALDTNYLPGKKIEVTEDLFNDGAETPATPGPISSDDFSLSTIKWTKGGNLVDSVSIDSDEGTVVIKLKQDYKNDSAKDLEGTIKIREKGTTKYYTATIATTVGYEADVDTLKLSSVGETVSIADALDVTGKVFKVTGASYGNLELSATGAVDVFATARVYKDEKFYFGANTDVDTAILKANTDVDGEIAFLNFVGTPSFSSTATVEFYAEKDWFVYENNNGKLTKSAAKWDEDTGAFILKTRTLGSYVFSEKELASAAASTDTKEPAKNDEKNPETGVDNVVGVAMVMAVVSLVAAGAVSLKK